jgi:ABC-2 type transport system permease protein
MQKFLAALYKEILVLYRDLPGLLILFLMPVILILIVTVAQENAMKSSKESRNDILFFAPSNSATSKAIRQGLENSGFYKIIDSYKQQPLNQDVVYKLIAEGEYTLGIILGRQDTTIKIVIDPVLQEQYKNSIISSLNFIIKGAQTRIAIETLLKGLAPGRDQMMDDIIRSSVNHMPPVSEVYPVKDRSSIKPSLSQNSIPGFILFAMFFIVIPLSGSMINEKKEGSFTRLKTLPVRVSLLLTSKVVSYLAVCIIQFVLMLAVGIWVLPGIFGLPAFNPGNEYFAIFLTTVASSLAAIGFGLIVGAYSTTHGQAALFGSVMVVILGIISGSFLPVHLFPKYLRYFSSVSPVRWGIDNYLNIFVRGESVASIVPNILLLLLFFVFALIISVSVFGKPR